MRLRQASRTLPCCTSKPSGHHVVARSCVVHVTRLASGDVSDRPQAQEHATGEDPAHSARTRILKRLSYLGFSAPSRTRRSLRVWPIVTSSMSMASAPVAGSVVCFMDRCGAALPAALRIIQLTPCTFRISSLFVSVGECQSVLDAIMATADEQGSIPACLVHIG